MLRVGVRELRQNLSAYLLRVGQGERFEVTQRGRPLAILGPVRDASTPLGRLVSSGRARAPEGDLLALPAPRGRRSSRGSDALAEQRGPAGE